MQKRFGSAETVHFPEGIDALVMKTVGEQDEELGCVAAPKEWFRWRN